MIATKTEFFISVCCIDAYICTYARVHPIAFPLMLHSFSLSPTFLEKFAFAGIAFDDEKLDSASTATSTLERVALLNIGPRSCRSSKVNPASFLHITRWLNRALTVRCPQTKWLATLISCGVVAMENVCTIRSAERLLETASGTIIEFKRLGEFEWRKMAERKWLNKKLLTLGPLEYGILPRHEKKTHT